MFHLNEADKKAHVIIAFQATFLGERILQNGKFVDQDAFLVASGIVATGIIGKELLFDKKFDGADVGSGFLGGALASAFFFMLPPKSFDLEVEGGFMRYSTMDSSESEPFSPPVAVMIDAQSTFWFGRAIGIHMFSGGMDNGKNDDSGKRLHYGGGLRAGIFQGQKARGRWPHLSFWAGADYGYLLFTATESPVLYPKSSYTVFYSAGMRVHTHGSFELSFEGQYVPYHSHRLLGAGASIGFTL